MFEQASTSCLKVRSPASRVVGFTQRGFNSFGTLIYSPFMGMGERASKMGNKEGAFLGETPLHHGARPPTINLCQIHHLLDRSFV